MHRTLSAFTVSGSLIPCRQQMVQTVMSKMDIPQPHRREGPQEDCSESSCKARDASVSRASAAEYKLFCRSGLM